MFIMIITIIETGAYHILVVQLEEPCAALQLAQILTHRRQALLQLEARFGHKHRRTYCLPPICDHLFTKLMPRSVRTIVAVSEYQ
jgi:hypothetical protein